MASDSFTSRIDLVRIDECFHRFHLVCVHRDWYMKRVTEKDEFGCEIQYKMPKKKKCAVCRREVGQSEMEYIQEQFKQHPEVDNKDYG